MTENLQNIDHEALAAEAARVELPPDTVAPGAGSVGDAGGGAPPPAEPQPPPAPWSEITPGLVEALDIAVCPNWDLTEGEKRALDAALAPALEQLFPGGIGDPRWAPYFRLLSVTVAVVAVRFDKKTLRLRPLRAPQEKTVDAAAPRSSFVDAAGDGRH